MFLGVHDEDYEKRDEDGDSLSEEETKKGESPFLDAIREGKHKQVNNVVEAREFSNSHF